MLAERKKRLILVAGLLAILAALLAVSVSNLELKPGEPFPIGGVERPSGGGFELGGGELILALIRGLLALGLVLLPIYILISLLSPEGRRRLLADLVMMTVLVLLALWLSTLAENTEAEPAQEQAMEQGPGPELSDMEMETQEMPTFEQEPDNWMVTLTVIVVALILAVLLFAITRSVLRGGRGEPSHLEQIAENAQQAVKAIRSGISFENVIIQCYAQMSQSIQESRGLQRGRAMTPQEFQDHLVNSGVPAEPVRALTRLFETVRYGHESVGDLGKRQAVESLNQIIAYCRGVR